MKFALGVFVIFCCLAVVLSFPFNTVRKSTSEPKLYFKDKNLFKMCFNSSNTANQIVNNLDEAKCVYLKYLDNICQTQYTHAFHCDKIDDMDSNTPELSVVISTPIPDVIVTPARDSTERLENQKEEKEDGIETIANCVYIFGGNNTIYLKEKMTADETDNHVVFFPSNTKVEVKRKNKSKVATKQSKAKKSKTTSRITEGKSKTHQT